MQSVDLDNEGQGEIAERKCAIRLQIPNLVEYFKMLENTFTQTIHTHTHTHTEIQG